MATKQIVGGHADGEYFHDAELDNIRRAAGGFGVLTHSISATVTESDMDIVLPAFDYTVPDGSGGKTRVAYAGATLTVTTADNTNPRNDVIVGDASGNVEIRAGVATAETGDVEDAPLVTLASDEILFAKIRVAAGVTAILASDITARAIDVSDLTNYRTGAGISATAVHKIAYDTTSSTLKAWDGSASVDIEDMTYIVKSADETVNNSSTLQNDDDFSFSVATNSKYLVEMYLLINSGTTPDFKYAWSLPASATANGVYNATSSQFNQNGNLTSAQSVDGAGGERMTVVFFILETAGTAGTAQFQWAQNTADLSNTVVGAGSVMRYRKVV